MLSINWIVSAYYIPIVIVGYSSSNYYYHFALFFQAQFSRLTFMNICPRSNNLLPVLIEDVFPKFFNLQHFITITRWLSQLNHNLSVRKELKSSLYFFYQYNVLVRSAFLHFCERTEDTDIWQCIKNVFLEFLNLS